MFSCGFNYYSHLDKNSNNKNSGGQPIIDPPVKYHADASSFSSVSTNFKQTVWISKDGKCYVTGNNRDCMISGSLPRKILNEDTELFLKDDLGRPCKFVSVHCGFLFTLYLVSDESGVTNFRLVFCYENKTPNPLFLNIGPRIPRALFGGDSTAGVIDSEGGIIVITNSIFNSPTQQILPTFLPHGDKAVKLSCCNSFMISLGESGRVYKSKISERSSPKFSEVTELSGKTVVDVTGTCDHCFAVLKDGRVFGIGNNWFCTLGLPGKTASVSSFTEIESLKKHKIVSAFAGTFQSIFKTSDGKMIVCGRNADGELFIPQRKTVYPPEEVKSFQGFSFCVVGCQVSSAFLRMDPPPNVANQKISETSSLIKNPKKTDTKRFTPTATVKTTATKTAATTTSELESLKKNLSLKDEEISRLKDENKKQKITMTSTLEKKEKEISSLKEEISQLKDENKKQKIMMTSTLEKKEKEISSLKEEISRLKEENTKLKNELKSKLKSKSKSNPEEDKTPKEKTHAIKIFTTREIESFEDSKKIGEGATSEVFEVTHKEKLAKKVLKGGVIERDESDENSDNEDEELKISIESLKRLLQECETLNRLDHPNIVKTYGFFFGDSTHKPAILLERCESNLKKRIKKLTNEERISAIVSLSSAMKKVHSAGIIHRDLKLENILLDSNNNVKLSDFGLCTFIKTDDETMSRTQMAGSLKFMSPELLQGRTDYDEKVDVYAFGVVVFVILTKGKYPDITFVEVANGKQAEIPSSITKFSRKLIEDCWSTKSSDRPSFSEICDRLKGNEHKII